jgi:hypothetical protein
MEGKGTRQPRRARSWHVPPGQTPDVRNGPAKLQIYLHLLQGVPD